MRERIYIVTSEDPRFSVSNAYTESLSVLGRDGACQPVSCTGEVGKPAFIADFILQLDCLQAKGLLPPPEQAYVGLTLCPSLFSPEDPRQFLYAKVLLSIAGRRYGLSGMLLGRIDSDDSGDIPMIDDTACTSFDDVLQIARQVAPGADCSSTIPVPALPDSCLEAMRNDLVHWTRATHMGGLGISALRRRGYQDMTGAFREWNDDADCAGLAAKWRSFFAICLWFSFLPESLPSQSAEVMPEDWSAWADLLADLGKGDSIGAERVSKKVAIRLTRCVDWMFEPMEAMT
jgi:hypothetical protein